MFFSSLFSDEFITKYFTRNLLVEDLNLDDAIKLYKTNGSLHETARILHTSHIRLSTLFKQHYIKITNIGKRRDISDGDIELIKKLYLEGVTISDISEKLKITVKKVRKILKESNIKTGRYCDACKKKPIVVNEGEILDRIYYNNVQIAGKWQQYPVMELRQYS